MTEESSIEETSAEKERKLTRKQQFIIELIMMIVVGFLVIFPLALYAYHFFI